MNGIKGILLAALMAIALALGGWNLHATVSHGEDIKGITTSFDLHKESAEKREARVEKKFDKIMNKLEDISTYISEQKGIEKAMEKGFIKK